MRIAFLGKGGSGKTTVTGAFVRWLKDQRQNVLAVDADMNSHLADVLGVTSVTRELGSRFDEVADYVRGHRTDLGSRPILSTTPPSPRSRFIKPASNDPFIENFGTHSEGVSFLAVGRFSEADVGANCYHTKLHSLCLVLNHLEDTERDYVVVDATAGVDTLSTALLIAYDLTVFVVEPTRKSVQVVQDYLRTAPQVADRVVVLANKIESDDDLRFITAALGDAPVIATISYSRELRKFEQGHDEVMNHFVSSNSMIWEKIATQLRSRKRNWHTMYSELAAIHKKNCEWWYNAFHGEALDTGLDDYSAIRQEY